MYDPGAPSSKLALAELAKESVRKSLQRYALWRTKDKDEAKDLVASALEVVLDPARKPWDPAQRSFFGHMRRVIDDLEIEEARSAYRRHVIVDVELAYESPLPDPQPRPDQALHMKREILRRRELGRRVLARIEDTDPIAARVFHAACAGHETPAEQAEHLGIRVEEVYEAMRRLIRHGRRVLEEWRRQEEERMKALRAKARIKTKPESEDPT